MIIKKLLIIVPAITLLGGLVAACGDEIPKESTHFMGGYGFVLGIIITLAIVALLLGLALIFQKKIILK